VLPTLRGCDITETLCSRSTSSLIRALAGIGVGEWLGEGRCVTMGDSTEPACFRSRVKYGLGVNWASQEDIPVVVAAINECVEDAYGLVRCGCGQRYGITPAYPYIPRA
jgi:hypothetical protein